MKTHQRAPLSVVALSLAALAALAVACSTTAQVGQTKPGNVSLPADYAVTGPYNYRNLSVFLLRGKDAAQGKTFLTLGEALSQKKVVVYETRDVNELAIENLSGEEVFVQSGDIVKGGQQDRMLAVDLILPPRSGRVAISAFCVEHGRWTKRGTETATRFDSSNDRVATKDLKLAARREKSQGQVWQKVEEAQSKLARNVAAPVAAAASPSSLQLTLENQKVRTTTDEYLNALSSIPAAEADVVGYAFSINGKINSAEVYASHALFLKLWPGLLKSSAVEAVAELESGAPAPVAAPSEVRAFLDESERGEEKQEDVGARVQLVTRESKSNIMFETRSASPAKSSAWVHRSYIKKE